MIGLLVVGLFKKKFVMLHGTPLGLFGDLFYIHAFFYLV